MNGIVVSGVIHGFYYALLGLGLVLCYRQSRIINFSYGTVASLAAYVAYSTSQAGAPYWLAALAAICAGAAASLVIERLVVRPLLGMSDVIVSVATLGVGLVLIGLFTILYGTSPLALPSALKATHALRVGPTAVGADQVLLIALTLCIVAGLVALTRYTRLGIALRASGEGPVTASVVGINVTRLRQAMWALSGAIGAVAALLITPQYDLDPNFFTDFMITAFVAIVLGGLESIGGAVAAGVAFGVISNLVAYYTNGTYTQALAFALVLLTLWFRPFGLLGGRSLSVNEPQLARRGRTNVARTLARRLVARTPRLKLRRPPAGLRIAIWLAATAVLLALIPVVTSPTYFYALVLTAATFPAALGQHIVSIESGQPSIGQSGFMGIGAYVFAISLDSWHLALLPAVVAALASCTVAGLLVAASCVRLRGLYLALLTLTFALAIPELAQSGGDLTGSSTGLDVSGISVAGHALLSVDSLYWASVVVAVVCALATWALARGRAGRRWRAVRDSEAGATSLGINDWRVRLEAFTLGAVLSGIGGVMVAIVIGRLVPNSFTVWTSVYLLLAVIVGGRSPVLGSAIGVAFITVLPTVFSNVPELSQIAFGAAIMLAIFVVPGGISGLLDRRSRGDGRRSATRPSRAERGREVVAS